jgi:hypothetical protein
VVLSWSLVLAGAFVAGLVLGILLGMLAALSSR